MYLSIEYMYKYWYMYVIRQLKICTVESDK